MRLNTVCDPLFDGIGIASLPYRHTARALEPWGKRVWSQQPGLAWTLRVFTLAASDLGAVADSQQFFVERRLVASWKQSS